MSFPELAKKRYSVRQYRPDHVEEEKLAKILEAARVAPSGHNNQPVKLIVVKEKLGLSKLKKGANIYGAPLAIITCSDRKAAWVRPYDSKSLMDIDASIATDHMMLQATELGLGTVWVCNFDPKVIKQEFNLPDNVEPVNILAVGYAAGEASSPDRHYKTRKSLNELVSYETY
ncbi:MAG: nitroreductase family protein [Bacillota bacterium]|nr:nitroreductase family protein [Bacillota bacterium]